jgi:hypothetical protein
MPKARPQCRCQAAQRCAEGAGLDSGAAAAAQSAMPSIAFPAATAADRRLLSTKAAAPAVPQLQPRISTSLTDVTVIIGSIRRRGVLFVLACLPDGSRALIPAHWTDWDEGHCGGVRACREASVGSRALSSLAICFSCAISSTLSAANRSGSAPPQKGCRRATEPGFFRPARSTGESSFGEPRTEPVGTARRARALRCPRDPGAPDCPHAGGGS